MAKRQVAAPAGERQRHEWTEFHERHADKIEFIPGVDCWAWVGAATRTGHGRANEGGRVQYAHRLSYEAYNGKQSDGLVRHLCGNAACVRPSHLAAGTHADNARDMALMGTSRSKISPGDAVKIRQKYLDGQSLQSIADEFGIAFGSVYPIVTGKSFKFAGGPISRALRSPPKLCERDVHDIRDKIAKGESQSSIARDYGVAQSVISRINTRDRWGSV